MIHYECTFYFNTPSCHVLNVDSTHTVYVQLVRLLFNTVSTVFWRLIQLALYIPYLEVNVIPIFPRSTIILLLLQITVVSISRLFRFE